MSYSENVVHVQAETENQNVIGNQHDEINMIIHNDPVDTTMIDNQIFVDRVITAGQENCLQNRSNLAEQVFPAGQESNPIALDMTNAVENVLDRMVQKNASAITLLSTTLTDYLSKLTGSITQLAEAHASTSSRNTGKLPVDTSTAADRNVCNH